MAFTLTNNSPSAGYISWTACNLTYFGVTYAIPAGNTNNIYVYWLYSSPNAFQTSNTAPSLGANDCIVFLNKSGVAVNALTATMLDGDLIVPGSILSNAIAANTITGGNIAGSTITGSNIAGNTISAGNIVANTISAGLMAVNAVGTNTLAALSVTADKIAVNSITAGQIASGTITATQIAGNTITGANIAGGTITGGNIAGNTISGSNIVGNTISAGLMAANAIGTNALAAQAITADKLYVTAVNLVNNFTKTNSTNGWSAGGTIVADPSTSGARGNVMKVTTSGNVQIASDYFAIDPTKTYKVTLSMTNKPTGSSNTVNSGNALYFGLNFYDASGNELAGTPFTVSTRSFGTAATNPYFYYTSGGTVVSGWYDMTAYVLSSTITDPAEVADGKNVSTHWQIPPNATQMRLRFLNYYNNASQDAYFYSPTISDVDSGKINASRITVGTLDANLVTVKNLNATNITTGTLDAGVINIARLSASSISTGTLDASLVNVTKLNASNITTGTLDASVITVKNLTASTISSLNGLNVAGGNFAIDTSGNVTVKGAITANSGYIGGTSGFTLTSNKFYSNGKSSYNSSTAGVYVGTDGIGLGTGNFYVDSSGNVTANSVTITGSINSNSGTIGGSSGFTVSTGKMYAGGKSSYNSSTAGVYIGTDGIGTGTGNFYVDSSGNLTANNATLTGTITANSGYIGGTSGFTLTSNKFYSNGKSSYNSSTSGVYVGTDGIGLGAGNFYVDSSGNLTANNATIKGNISGSAISGSSVTVNGSNTTFTVDNSTGILTSTYVNGQTTYKSQLSQSTLQTWDGNGTAYISGNLVRTYNSNSTVSLGMEMNGPYGFYAANGSGQSIFTTQNGQAYITDPMKSSGFPGLLVDGPTTINGTLNSTAELSVAYSGAAWMSSSQSITCSIPLSKTLHGWVLAWSDYTNSTAGNYDWVYTFIPKNHGYSYGGTGVHNIVTSSTGNYQYMVSKYLYVSDGGISGHSSNTADSNENNIVLRAVYAM